MPAKCYGGSLLISLLSISLLAAEKPIDISAVVSKTEAEKILGEPVRNPTALNVNGKDGYYSKCNYYSTKSVRSLLLRVRQASEPGEEAANGVHLCAVRCLRVATRAEIGAEDQAGPVDQQPVTHF